MGDLFGCSVAFAANGFDAVIGASGDDTSNGINAGSAYVFERSGPGTWLQTAQLSQTSNGAAGNSFGTAVAIGSGHIVVSAPLTDDTANMRADVGAVVIFRTTSGTPVLEEQLLGPSPGDHLGTSVDIDDFGDTVLASAGSVSSHRVVEYTRTGTDWTQSSTLSTSGGLAGETIASVSLSGDGNTALVGLPARDIGFVPSVGLVHLFRREGNAWSRQQTLNASDFGEGDRFGASVSLSQNGTVALFGANSADTGRGIDAGSAYVFVAMPTLVAAPGSTPLTQTVDGFFTGRLAVFVTDDTGRALDNVPVTFTAPPSSGPSGRFQGAFQTRIVNSDGAGLASAPIFQANSVAGTYTVVATTPNGGVANFTLTNTASTPSTITFLSGGNQSATVSTNFAAPLRAVVRDAFENPVSNVSVTFAAPSGSVPSANFAGNTTATNASGVAQITPTANGRPGTYSVTATVFGGAAPAVFSLRNTPSATAPRITGFTPNTAPAGNAATVTITGQNFTAGATVTFGGTAATTVTSVTATSITATAPALGAGTVNIVVTNPGTPLEPATVGGFTYLPAGGVAPAPGSRPLPGSSGGMGAPAPAPAPRAAPEMPPPPAPAPAPGGVAPAAALPSPLPAPQRR